MSLVPQCRRRTGAFKCPRRSDQFHAVDDKRRQTGRRQAARGRVKSLEDFCSGNRPVPHAEIFSIFVIFVVNNQNSISF